MRISSLDGVRGAAVLMVVFAHYSIMRMGWVGVDLFFVLSGFLITGILYRSKEDSDYWSTFYRKRALRILPLLSLLLATAFLMSGHIGPKAAMGYTFFLGNLVNATGHSIPSLAITWSLSVEEHFYLFWPIAVLYLNRKQLIGLTTALIFLEPILRAIATHYISRLYIYNLTPFRLDGLAAGSLLALLLADPRAESLLEKYSLSAFLACVGLYVMLRLAVGEDFSFAYNHYLFNSIGYSLVALSSVCLISHLLSRQEGRLSALFSFGPLVILGRISYGVYLLHVLVKSVTMTACKFFSVSSLGCTVRNGI